MDAKQLLPGEANLDGHALFARLSVRLIVTEWDVTKKRGNSFNLVDPFGHLRYQFGTYGHLMATDRQPDGQLDANLMDRARPTGAKLRKVGSVAPSCLVSMAALLS